MKILLGFLCSVLPAKFLGRLCDRSTPKSSPMPTTDPTLKGTNIPTTVSPATTNIPTVSPTATTNIPTVSPTNIPTVSPTNIPTVSPTNIPTTEPTLMPTINCSVLEQTGSDGTAGNFTPCNTEIEGTYLGINQFVVEENCIVTVNGTLIVSAQYVRIDGILDATGSGEAGGDGVSASISQSYEDTDGIDGFGPGAGGYGTSDLSGSVTECTGGGGAGYVSDGGDGGDSVGNGGSMYMSNNNSDFREGSGGGSGGIALKTDPNFGGTVNIAGVSGAGGSGGGSIQISSTSVCILGNNGEIRANGKDGGDGMISTANATVGFGACGGGGGGSGGSIALKCCTLDLHGLLSAAGGKGGDKSDEFRYGGWAEDGGGGSGGKIFLGEVTESTLNVSSDVSGGEEGDSPGGGNGTLIKEQL